MKVSIDKVLGLIDLNEGDLLRSKLKVNLAKLQMAKIEFFINKSFFENEKVEEEIGGLP